MNEEKKPELHAGGRNIIIYSDGTGNSGGLFFDENRTNIYKMYRATRVGPDSSIDPRDQMAFYDPGLGSKADGGGYWGGLSRRIYNVVSQATGFGITANMIDCYAALLKLWRPGDRIFLFGFSRGAYTIRCLAAVISFCGIPTSDRGKPLKRDPATLRRIASYAVKSVYQFTSSRKKDAPDTTDRQRFFLKTRDLIAARFREDNSCHNANDPSLANVYPYFIGVFDTVAALINKFTLSLLIIALLVIALVAAWPLSLLSKFDQLPLVGWLLKYLSNYWISFVVIIGTAFFVSLVGYVYTHLKFNFGIKSYNWWQKLRTIHFTGLWQQFYDFNLNRNIPYAKHAISIDENRRDFKRVKWGVKEHKYPERDINSNLSFEQVWFAGVHADIGGGYPENEARLSDIALKWMLACATSVPHGIKYDKSVLRFHPDPGGSQNDQVKSARTFGISWSFGLRELPGHPDHPNLTSGIIHPSVYNRFDLPEVLCYDDTKEYRPEALRYHIDFHEAYNGKPRPKPTMDADPIEDRMDQREAAELASSIAQASGKPN